MGIYTNKIPGFSPILHLAGKQESGNAACRERCRNPKQRFVLVVKVTNQPGPSLAPTRTPSAQSSSSLAFLSFAIFASKMRKVTGHLQRNGF